MAGSRQPGTVGTKAPSPRKGAGAGHPPVAAGLDWAGPTGANDALQQTITRTVVRVIKDWEPPNPRTTPEIVANGSTLAQVAEELNALPEWGEGGGAIRSERIPPGTSTEVTVTLHANLVKRLPRWARYAQASVAARAEWDRMMGNLRGHEQHHVDIAIEEADTLADDLIGVEIGQVASMVTAANGAMLERQREYDNDTHHGQDEGVTLDISIT